METEIVAPATPTDTAPPVETPAESTPEPSIAEHEAQFGKGTPKEPTTEEEQPKPRHRAKSQQASAGDVPRINELTKKLRDAERERDEWKAKVSSAPAPEPVRQAPASEPPKPAATGKPSWSTFEAQIGEKYQTWGEAQDAYVDARDEWKDAQAKQARDLEQQSSAQQAVVEGYITKARTYAETTPDYFDKMKAAAPILDTIPALLYQSILRHDNAPEILYYLVNHPSDLDDMCLLADGKPVNESSVALLQRRLSHYRSPAVVTGSVPAVIPPKMAPRPPNPVRTGPLKTTDEPPGDDASIAEHEKYYGKRRR